MRSLNKVTLIGNLTRDPEQRETNSGSVVVSFSIATNRSWITDKGAKNEEVDYHKIVVWNKLAEICAKHLKKGDKTYIEGRLTTRKWKDKDGIDRQVSEIIATDVLFLNSSTKGGEEDGTTINEPRKISRTPEQEPF